MTATETLASLTSPSPLLCFLEKAAFLAAQWCYVFCFTRESGGGPSQAQATLCFAYAGSLYAYLYNGLDSALALPVLLYCVSIATTMASSLAAHPGSNA